jgi:signal transduction histidine kinase
MKFREPRVAIGATWGVVGAFAVIQAMSWAPHGILGGILWSRAAVVQAVAAWTVILILAVVSTRRILRFNQAITAHEQAHIQTLEQVVQLELSNAVLQVVARSVDVPLAFQTLAERIVLLVECDRVGLALLSDNGEEFQTYTARVNQEERRSRPRPDMIFKTERTAIGSVVKSREPLVIDDTSVDAPDFLDINVLQSAGLRSALLLPLLTKGRAVGTLNVVSRQLAAFGPQQIEILQPIAEIFAVAHVAQQLQIAVGKYRSMEVMSELTLSIAAEMNSALQTIIGHCDLLERGYPDPHLQQDLATVVHQAQRISALLERMRAAAQARLHEVAETVSQGGIPTSPEVFGEKEAT